MFSSWYYAAGDVHISSDTETAQSICGGPNVISDEPESTRPPIMTVDEYHRRYCEQVWSWFTRIWVPKRH
jgi:hypothetical protein